MSERFCDMLHEGGKTNSLGRAGEVVELVLADQERLDELYGCISNQDAWVRMRAIDSFEKICRVHPEWVRPYVERILTDLTDSEQASIQWHVAQLLAQVKLSSDQEKRAINWLLRHGKNVDADWIVASNTMETLAQFTREGRLSEAQLRAVLAVQQEHHSPAVRKRATKLLAEMNS